MFNHHKINHGTQHEQHRPQAIKQRLDSVVTENDYKYTFSYDASGNNTEEVTYTWDSTKTQWSPSEKHNYTYDFNKNLIEDSWPYWNDGTNQWTEPRGKYIYEYDSNGRKVKETFIAWSPPINGVIINRTTHSFTMKTEVLKRK